jgi:hypothetical protein
LHDSAKDGCFEVPTQGEYMLTQKMVVPGLTLLVMALVLIAPTQSFAGSSWSFSVGTGHSHWDYHDRHDRRHNHHSHWRRDYHDHNYYRYHHRPHYGLRVSYLPSNCTTIWSGGARYSYCDGYYYRKEIRDYVVVEPPVTTVITAPVTYVQQEPLVAKPVGSTVNSSTAVTASEDDQYFTVNIPNTKGGYTQVTVKRSGEGFVGPQGEYYNTFPPVAQLKAMYVK